MILVSIMSIRVKEIFEYLGLNLTFGELIA